MLNYRLFKDNGLTIKSISKINNSYLVSDGNNRYIIKNHKNDLNNI